MGQVCFKVWQKTRQGRCDPAINDRLVGVHWSVDSLRGTPHDPHLGPDWEALTRVGVLVRGGAELVKAAGASKEPDECAGESLSGGGCRKTVLRASMDGLNRAT